MKYKFLTLFLTMMMVVSVHAAVLAEDKEYKLSAIDLIVSVDGDLNALTRGVSESNPALEILGTDAVSMQNIYIRNNIYLDVFPDDMRYEILITATELADKENAGFDTLEDAALLEYMERLNEEFAAAPNSELLSMDLYENDVTKYIHTSTLTTQELSDRTVSVYAERYYTVMNGFNYYFTLQTNDPEMGGGLSSTLTAMVNSAQYTELKSSLGESGFFNEMYEMFMGFGLTVLILGTILFLITRKPKR
ncbi:MAG: hypothetical protein NC086_09720 [Alistipes sp.]|nr:hypothetical protein [Alistipes sp.]